MTDLNGNFEATSKQNLISVLDYLASYVDFVCSNGGKS
jgi:hypothetical protein